ncbi:hypothetical protein [Methanobrevibacter sp.]|uniref:hypothetical protein n=1 Tax=Methanobrevibacter sp. TaxID=66852 RepID=UPI00388ED4DE
MVIYCDNCGEKIEDDSALYCKNCGNPLHDQINSTQETFIEKNKLPIIGALILIIIILFGALLVSSNFFTATEETAQNIENEPQLNNTKTTVIKNEETQPTSSEPDYESFQYTHSFADTDRDGDGYVLLNDMHIVHTPENIQHQMYADSDDNHDGKLNEHEYYKFMYKLNYDKHSYGL